MPGTDLALMRAADAGTAVAAVVPRAAVELVGALVPVEAVVAGGGP
jgi:hypothetical protein